MVNLDPDYLVVRTQVNVLASLVPALPISIPLATANDQINQIFKHIPATSDEGPWHAFNRRFDNIFGEDQRDENGRLKHLRRGPLGMDMIVDYLKDSVNGTWVLWPAARPKVERLVAEVTQLM
jgi:hypothetical protein